MASPADLAALTNAHVPRSPNTIEPYLKEALHTSNTITHPVHLFNPNSPSLNHATCTPDPNPIWPTLKKNCRNNILLFPGSFSPPHQGHLATINYFSKRRHELNITTMFIFADPSSIIASKSKRFNNIILPQSLRNQMFFQVPEISQLIADHWLYLLVGDMEGHIMVLRNMTDLIAEAGWDVKLVGFLGGDKLSKGNAPHLPPGELGAWGLVDEFLIVNARRPVDFYDPGKDERPHDLPGCTAWKRVAPLDDEVREAERSIGKLWVCKGLTVPGEPWIQFRASERSASDGISSTRIRRSMTETPDGGLQEQLKGKVLSIELLMGWLKRYRQQ
ncbi:hypothetical protein BDZ45DRAFT_775359 [Acephala macrosclerotiorum]|nr:hypothetical protein BDZ45DRAFT_775359 [Acephala macrosclerotiorum]